MIGIAFAFLSLSASKPSCAPAAIQPALDTTAKALNRNDLAGARAAIAPFENCPVESGTSYAAHVLRADVAVRENDWPTARAMLAGIGVHAENGLAALAGVTRLRADQGLDDKAAFTADRAALIEANDQALRRIGRKIESFRAGAVRVDAYEAAVTQGGFLRVLEVMIVPDDTAAYPAAIMLSDDRSSTEISALISPGKGAPGHLWFVDLYGCGGHTTLAPVKDMTGAKPPAYTDVKTQVLATLADGGMATAAPPPPGASCVDPQWMFPGFGAPRP